MAARQMVWKGTLIDGAAATSIPLAMKYEDSGFQVSVEGTAVVTVVSVEGPVSITQTTMTGESLIFDLQGVDSITLAAAGANADYKVRIRQTSASTPQSNWNTLQAPAT